MNKLVLTPLGAGNYQYVLRIKSKSNRVNKITETDSIPNCVLKILKDCNLEDYKSRLLFHYQFMHFFNDFYNNDCLKDKNVSPYNLNIHNKVLCIIDKDITSQIRQVFNKLLKSLVISNDEQVETRDNERVKIFYDKNLENTYSINISSESIKRIPIKIDSNSVNDFNFSLIDNFKNDQYEFCSIEQDLFNIHDFLKVNNSILSDKMPLNFNEYNHNTGYLKVHDRINNSVKELIPDQPKFGNLTLELKLKCGLLNFRGVPSLFKMGQINKKNFSYLYSNGSVVYAIKGESFYEPTNFFKLTYESVKSELIKLVETQQNNVRVFIDNFEVSPDILTHREELLETVVDGVLCQKKILELLLKLHSLAAGQQFIASLLYSIFGLSLLVYNQNSFFLKELDYTNDNDCNLLTNTSILYNFNENNNKNPLNIINILKKRNLYNQFTSNRPYEMQSKFYQYGLKLFCKICTILFNLLSTLKLSSSCSFYCNLYNMSIYRSLSFKASVAKCNCCFNISNNPLYSILSHITLHILKFKNSDWKSSAGEKHGIELVMLNDMVIKHVIKTFYSTCSLHFGATGNKQLLKLMLKKIVTPQLRNLERHHLLLREWLYLYLCGRVSMDLSVIFNILYNTSFKNNETYVDINSTNNSSKRYAQNGKILLDALSFIDVDLKPIQNIYKLVSNES